MNNYYDPYLTDFYPNEMIMPNQTNNTSLADVYQGFLRGNMYNNLYNPYKNYNIPELKPTTEKEAMLIEIQAYYFSLIDLNLYLDVYPNNNELITTFNNNKQILNTLITNYETKYGPLSILGNGLNTSPWSWDNNPWPWEGIK